MSMWLKIFQTSEFKNSSGLDHIPAGFTEFILTFRAKGWGRNLFVKNYHYGESEMSTHY